MHSPQMVANPLQSDSPVRSAADVFPDIALRGNYLFWAVFFQELCYRGYLLTRMRRVFGKADWIANGLLFTLRHVYQRWLYAGIAVPGLSFAFMAGPADNLPLATIAHYLGDFLMPAGLLTKAVIG